MHPDRERPWQDVAERLKSVRATTNLDQREFAARIGIAYSRYKNWETGAHRISLDGALAVAGQFGTSLDYIYGPLLTNRDRGAVKR